MTINYARESVIDFTKPFMNLGIGILFKVIFIVLIDKTVILGMKPHLMFTVPNWKRSYIWKQNFGNILLSLLLTPKTILIFKNLKLATYTTTFVARHNPIKCFILPILRIIPSHLRNWLAKRENIKIQLWKWAPCKRTKFRAVHLNAY